MRWIIGGFVGLIGVAAIVPAIKKIKEKRTASKVTDYEMLAEMDKMNRQMNDLMKKFEAIDKKERELRKANNELMKELIMMMKEENPDIIIM